MISERATGKDEPLEDRLERLEKQSQQTLTLVQEIRALLEPPESKTDPVKVLKRYLMWLVVHVGQIEERVESVEIGVQTLLVDMSMPSSPLQGPLPSEAMMDVHEDEDSPF